MHLIVTRPQADSDRLKTRLEASGHTASVVPLLTIQADPDAAIPDKPWQAVAVTSANALSAASARGLPENLHSVPVFAVGPASAGLARDSGFADVRQAGGDLNELLKDMQQSLKAGNGPILYLTGKVRSGDLAASLQSGGFEVDRVELYDAVPATRIPPQTKKAIRSGKADGVVLYSARTADVWVQLVKRSRLTSKAEHLVHFCLSAAVAEKIRTGLGSNVSIVISNKPDDDAMLQAIADTALKQPIHNASPGKGATMANRKTPSRKARKPARPTVIDAKATEIKTADTARTADAEKQNPGPAAGGPGSGKTPDKPEAPSKDAAPDSKIGKTPSDKPTAGKPTASKPTASKPAPDKQAPAKKPSGKAKLLTGALVATLLAGVGVGGYLYREHGARLFGPGAPAIDVSALESQAQKALGSAQSASETASTALAETQTLSDKFAGLEQQLTEARNAVPAPDPEMQATIKAASELASSAKSDIEVLTAKAGENETAIAGLRQSVSGLKTALQAAADSGGGAGQAEVNLKFDELAQRIDQLASAKPQPDAAAAIEIATLRDQLAAANARIEKLESAGSSSGNADVSGDVSALGEQLAAATTRIDDLESRLSEALDSQPQPAAVDTGKIAGQLTALSAMVNQGKPFQAELVALQETAKLTLNLPALTTNANTGIMTNDQLKQSLVELKGRLDADAAPDPAGTAASSGLWSTLTGKLSSVVKVRKVTGDTDWSGQVAAAISALDAGGLDAAIAALDSGGASAPADVANWIIEARKRLSAAEELQKLPQIILDHLPAPAQ